MKRQNSGVVIVVVLMMTPKTCACCQAQNLGTRPDLEKGSLQTVPDFELKRSPWITWVARYPIASVLLGKAEAYLRQKRERPRDPRGRDWREVAASQGMQTATSHRMLEGTKEGFSSRVS